MFLTGAATETAVTVAASVAEGLPREHLPVFDACAAEPVVSEPPSVILRRVERLKEERDPKGAATRARDAADRRRVRARAEGDGQGSMTFPAERAGHGDDPTRQRIAAQVLVIVSAGSATGAGNAIAEVAGMGSIVPPRAPRCRFASARTPARGGAQRTPPGT